MEMDPIGIPDGLKEGWPGIVAGALRVFKDLPKAVDGVLLCTTIRVLLSDFFLNSQQGKLWRKSSRMTPTTREVMMGSIWTSMMRKVGDLCQSLQSQLLTNCVARGCLGWRICIHGALGKGGKTHQSLTIVNLGDEFPYPILQGARLRERNEKRDAGEAASDTSSESEEIEEELGFFSPLDSIDPYVTFQRALTGEIRPFQQEYAVLY